MKERRITLIAIERQCWLWSGEQRTCRAPGCEEPAFYEIRWPKQHTTCSDVELSSDRCSDHALEYARRYRLSFPGLRTAA